MGFAYALYDIAGYFYNIGFQIVITGQNMLGVYLIGGYLAIPFFEIGGRVMLASTSVANAGHRWEEAYNEIRNGVSLPPIVQELINWGHAIIDFIANRDHFIISVIRSAFSGLDVILRSTYTYILPHVLAIIYNHFPFIRDIVSKITETLNNIIPNFSILRYNPIQWVMDRIRAYSQALSRFISDPDGYIKERLYIFFPSLKLFFDDPANYIIEKLSDKLETFAERNLSRLIKIVENALNNIF